MIIIYTSPGCGPCVATKRALDRAGLAYEERAGADWPEEVERLVRIAGSRQGPLVVAGDQVWSGFRADLIETCQETGIIKNALASSPSPP